MVKKSLHEADFSNEAIIACVHYNIHYLDELLKYFNQDRKLRMFNEVIPDVKEEILLKCKESEEVDDESRRKYSRKKEHEYQSVVTMIPENLQLATSLEELVNAGVLSKKTWQSLGINNITDVNGFVNHYLKSNSYRDLRCIGTLKNNEATILAKTIINKIKLTIGVEQNPVANFSFTAGNVLPDKLKMLLDIRKGELKRSITEFFETKVLILSNENKLASMLNSLMKNPKIIPALGKKGNNDLKKFLNEYKSLCIDQRKHSAIRKEYLIQSLRKLAWVDDNWINANDLELNKPLQLLYNIINDATTLKNNDQFILRNVNTIKIIEEGQGLKYEDALNKYNQSHSSLTVLNTFKVWINRTKNKLIELLDDIMNELPELKMKLNAIFKLSGDFVVFQAEHTDSINEQNNTDFSDLFFDLLISRLNPDYYSLNGPGKRMFTELAFVKNDKVKNNHKFEGLLKTLSNEFNKPSAKERIFNIVSPVKECLNNEFGVACLVEFLKTQNNEVKFEGESLIFPPTHVRKKSLGELVYKVIEENNVPMHYDDIISRFREKYPDVKLSAYRSLRDAMDKSENITSMGGKSNHFLLNEWKAKYYVGPNKEFIIDFLQKKQPAHFFEIYRHISTKRPGVKVITVTEILSGLSELFYYHGGGYYSLSNNASVNKKKIYPRTQKGIYSFIEKNRQLLTNQAELIKLLKKQFKEYSLIQLEYAIYQVSEKQV